MCIDGLSTLAKSVSSERHDEHEPKISDPGHCILLDPLSAPTYIRIEPIYRKTRLILATKKLTN